MYNQNMNISRYNLDIGKLNEKNSELPILLNDMIGHTDGDMILFSFGEGNTGESSVTDPSADDCTDVVVTAYIINEAQDTVILNPEYIISNYDMSISSILIKRSILVKTGCFNEFLGTGCVLEFIYRAAFMGMKVSCDNKGPGIAPYLETASVSDDTCMALAYMMCRHRLYASDPSCIPGLLNYIVGKLKEQKSPDVFMRMFGRLTSDPKYFNRLLRNTAPIYMIAGDDLCYGLLNHFSNELTRIFIKKGQAVMTTDGRYAPFASLNEIKDIPVKAFTGFQAGALFKDFFQRIETPKFQFWFDDPAFFNDLFQNLNDTSYMLCQDGNHADFLKRRYGIAHAYQLAPGAEAAPVPDFSGRELDIIFIGTFKNPPQLETDDLIANELYEYMCSHTYMTYEQSFDAVIEANGLQLEHEAYINILYCYAPVYRLVQSKYRMKVIEAIVNSGLKLHVYGDSWYEYSGSGQENLIIHPSLSQEELPAEMRRAKINLNIMSWHKAGMTERVIYSMLAGSVCLSDQTSYLQSDVMRELVPQYDLDHLDELPDIIRSLLGDNKRREDIAKRAYDHAMKHDTWESRADVLLELMRQ